LGAVPVQNFDLEWGSSHNNSTLPQTIALVSTTLMP
jgi:hypothetical protein